MTVDESMDSKLTDNFWTHTMNTIVHIQNRVMLKTTMKKLPTSYGKEVQTKTSTSRLNQKFAKDMQNEFEMSLLKELSFFLGLQIRQSNQGIFISQANYIREMLNRLGM
jgi:hypothetical protein